MKFFKLFLLILPMFVLADNPILPADIDSVQESSVQEAAEQVVQEEPVQVKYSDSKINTTESNYKEETPRDFVLFSFIFSLLII